MYRVVASLADTASRTLKETRPMPSVVCGFDQQSTEVGPLLASYSGGEASHRHPELSRGFAVLRNLPRAVDTRHTLQRYCSIRFSSLPYICIIGSPCYRVPPIASSSAIGNVRVVADTDLSLCGEMTIHRSAAY